MSRYKARNAAKLKAGKLAFRLEFSKTEYNRYLQSEWWAKLRSMYLKGKPCSGCGRPAGELHHVTYANIGRETAADVMPLCSGCHNEVHRRLEKAGKSVEWTAWALRRMFGWTRKEVNRKFGLNYTGAFVSVIAGKI